MKIPNAITPPFPRLNFSRARGFAVRGGTEKGVIRVIPQKTTDEIPKANNPERDLVNSNVKNIAVLSAKCKVLSLLEVTR